MPVSGGPRGAKAASLSIMIGGRDEVIERLGPILKRLGTTIVHLAEAGSGQTAKIANQIAIGGAEDRDFEAYLFLRASRLPTEAIRKTVQAGVSGLGITMSVSTGDADHGLHGGNEDSPSV